MVPYELYPTLLLIHLAATLFMVGLIWFVQIVHYPLMAGVHQSSFQAYETLHVSQTFKVVMPVMVLELVVAGLLVFDPVSDKHQLLGALGFSALLLIWASTALLQVPAHQKLSEGFDEATHRRLVNTNWIRTLLWSARGAIALAFFYP